MWWYTVSGTHSERCFGFANNLKLEEMVRYISSSELRTEEAWLRTVFPTSPVVCGWMTHAGVSLLEVAQWSLSL